MYHQNVPIGCLQLFWRWLNYKASLFKPNCFVKRIWPTSKHLLTELEKNVSLSTFHYRLDDKTFAWLKKNQTYLSNISLSFRQEFTTTPLVMNIATKSLSYSCINILAQRFSNEFATTFWLFLKIHIKFLNFTITSIKVSTSQSKLSFKKRFRDYLKYVLQCMSTKL